MNSNVLTYAKLSKAIKYENKILIGNISYNIFKAIWNCIFSIFYNFYVKLSW